MEAIAANGAALADAAERAGLDAAVPTCPGWTVRDLLGHQGGVHRWATSYVADADTSAPAKGFTLAEPPGDGEIVGWFRDGCSSLVAALREARDDMTCWTFLPAPFPRAFWARRQAHETAIHRVDAESAAGTQVGFDPAFAVDGIDELILGFYARPRGRLLADPAITLGIDATDGGADAAWTITVGPQSRETTRGKAHGDCVLSGPASDLYQLMWNRRGTDGLDVSGDESVLDVWRTKAAVTWS